MKFDIRCKSLEAELELMKFCKFYQKGIIVIPLGCGRYTITMPEGTPIDKVKDMEERLKKYYGL